MGILRIRKLLISITRRRIRRRGVGAHRLVRKVVQSLRRRRNKFRTRNLRHQIDKPLIRIELRQDLIQRLRRRKELLKLLLRSRKFKLKEPKNLKGQHNKKRKRNRRKKYNTLITTRITWQTTIEHRRLSNEKMDTKSSTYNRKTIN